MPEQTTRSNLEERLTAVEGYQDNFVGEHLVNRIKTLEEEVKEVQAVKRENAQLRARVNDVEAQLESVVGLAEDQQSTPEKRAADVRMSLIRRAEARGENEPDKASMHYKDVKETLADLGHGKVWKQQAFDAMEDASEAAGFAEGQKTKDGNKVKAVLVDLAELPAHAASNEITTGGTGGQCQNTENHAD